MEVRRANNKGLLSCSLRLKLEMNKTHKMLIGTMLLLGLGTVSVAQNADAADPFKRFYNEACIPEAKKAGLTNAEAAQGCNCTVKTLRNKYSTQAFSTLFNKYLSGDSAARRTLTNYGETCFEDIFGDILFEE